MRAKCNLIARGVCPPVGEWLARSVRKSLERDEPNDWPVTLVDVRKPPGSTTRLPSPTPPVVVKRLTEMMMEESNATDVVDEWADLYPVGPAPTAPAEEDWSNLYPVGQVPMAMMPAPLLAIPMTKPQLPPVPRPRAVATGSGAYVRSLLPLRRWTDQELIEAIHRHYPGSKAGMSDIAWNRAKLAKETGCTVAELRAIASCGELPPGPGGEVAPAVVTLTVPAPVTPVPAVVPDALAQPTRTGKIRVEREFDTTALTKKSHGYRVHRDYAAHFFRWGFASKFVDETMSVLEIGCGVDYPFVKTLIGAYAKGVPNRYVGVDLNKLDKPPYRPWATFHGEFDFTSRYGELGQFDRIICFEVIEHCTIVHGRELLAGAKTCLKPGGLFLLSTPVYNGIAAFNHIHEYEIDELRAMIEEAGFTVEKRYGTFANLRDIKKVATPEQFATLEALNKFYSTDVTACFLAPLYPDASRNNVWLIRHQK